VHFQDPHGPYTPPAPLRARFLEAERRAPDGGKRLALSGNDTGIGGIPAYQLAAGELEAAYYRAGYDGEAYYADEHIGRLLRGLAGRGLDDETITVFAADHGEGLGEGDYWFAHGEYLSEPLLRVPLLIAVPGRRQRVDDQVASLVDVLPTLAALLEMPLSPGLPGRNLLVDDGDRASTVYLSTFEESQVPRIGMVQGSWKYVATADPAAPARQLYRVGSDDADVLHDHPDVAQAMASALDAFQRRLPGTPARAQPATPEDRARLRALGYVGE
jgi:arylsulfatase A-like enzyme